MGHRAATRFVFRADDRCLDFLNTEIFSRETGCPADLVQDLAALLDWLVDAGLLEPRRAAKLRDRTTKEEARKVHAAAVRFRTELRRAAERLATGQAVPNSTISAVNQILQEPLASDQLTRVDGQIVKRRSLEINSAADVLFPIAEAAADLLASARAARVRQCEGPQCILFFLDTTKNHTRRWCSMEACGNRVKVAEHRRRAQQSTQ